MGRRFEYPLPETIEAEPEQGNRDILGGPRVVPAESVVHKSTSSVNSLEEIGADNFRGKNPNNEEDRQV